MEWRVIERCVNTQGDVNKKLHSPLSPGMCVVSLTATVPVF